MAKRIMQFRYYGDGNTSNQPKTNDSNTTISYNTLIDGKVFKNYLPFTKLGIQALPGTRFSLNDGPEIIIGSTGIYELDLEGISKINNLKFAGQSLSIISNNNGVGLIIDAVCEGGAN